MALLPTGSYKIKEEQAVFNPLPNDDVHTQVGTVEVGQVVQVVEVGLTQAHQFGRIEAPVEGWFLLCDPCGDMTFEQLHPLS